MNHLVFAVHIGRDLSNTHLDRVFSSLSGAMKYARGLFHEEDRKDAWRKFRVSASGVLVGDVRSDYVVLVTEHVLDDERE